MKCGGNVQVRCGQVQSARMEVCRSQAFCKDHQFDLGYRCGHDRENPTLFPCILAEGEACKEKE